MPLDPSEVDHISTVTKVPIQRLVDWKNRAGDPFELRCRPLDGGAFHLELNTPQPTVVESAVPLVHGDYESRKEDDGTVVYKALPGNTMGQALTPDGRPAFGVAYDITELGAEGKPTFKVYFGSASEWYVKNQYHAKWNELRDVRRELEPDAVPPPPPTDEPRSKEAGRNPRDAARSRERAEEPEQRHGRRRRGRRGGRGRK